MQPYDGINKYIAGVKLSPALNTATIVLLQRTGTDAELIDSEILDCSNHLEEVWKWIDQKTGQSSVTVAAGIDSSVLRFLDIRIPVVDEPQRHRLIQTQAEAFLPLSADQMLLAWQSERDSQGLLCRTAVARKELVQPVLQKVGKIQVLAPEAVGLAAIWRRLGGSTEQPCVLLHRRKDDFIAALLQNGHLVRSSVIDAEETASTGGQFTDLLLQDIQTELEIMGNLCGHTPAVFILAENSADNNLDTLCERIRKLSWQADIAPVDICSGSSCGFEGLEAFGLAHAAASGEPVEYDFKRVEALERPTEAAAGKGAQLRKTLVITLLLLSAALLASHWRVKKDVELLQEVMSTSHEDLTVQQVLKEQSYRESIARARPDMLDLFERIQKCQKSILLDTFEFEKGKPVKITATAGGYDAAYQFQKELETQNKNVITKVRLLEPRLDPKGGKVKFTITFHYRNFCK